VLGAGAAWGVAVGGTASLFQAAAVRTHATSGEMAGAWINASSNVGIAGGAAIGAALLGPFGVGGLPWVAAALVGAALVVVVTARRAFPAAA
jgi:predicted MFS family arabinose efflux permease